MLRELGASDLDFAFNRACLQGQLDTARQLHTMGARPARDALMGPAETLNPDGMKFLLDLGAEISDADGNRFGPVALVLETYNRHPESKHACLDLLHAHGISL